MNATLVTTLQIAPNTSGGSYDARYPTIITPEPVCEAYEVAINLPMPSFMKMTMDEMREHVKQQMPGESYQVIDNVTECLYNRHHH